MYYLYCSNRLPADTFPNKELCTYVRTITDLACYGMPTIVKIEPSVLIVSAEDTRVTSEILYRSCVTFLVSLVDTSTVVGSYSSIVHLHCVYQLLQAASDSKLSRAVQNRVYGLLGALARTCSMPASQLSQAAQQSQSMFGLAVCSLTEAVRRSVEMATSADSVGKTTLIVAIVYYPDYPHFNCLLYIHYRCTAVSSSSTADPGRCGSWPCFRELCVGYL